MSRSLLGGRDAGIAAALGMLVLIIAATELTTRYVPHTFIQRDGRFYTNVNLTLAESGSVVQNEMAASWYEDDLFWNRNLDAAWSNLSAGRGDNRLPKHPLLLPILSTPFFWAFGLDGLLLFNVLLIAFVGGLGFLFARRYASVFASALAAGAFVLATSLRTYVYDYHVDVLLLTLFLGALVALQRERPALGGLLYAATLTLKPTALMWAPSLLLVLIASTPSRNGKRPRLRAFGWALLGGTIVLGLYAIGNWALYGKPWWSGYNRVLIMVQGKPEVADVANAFSVPFAEGFERLWSGYYGLQSRFTLMILSLPGWLYLGRRQKAYGIASLFGVAIAIAVFARYTWEGDRFLWPAMALLIPAVAATGDLIASVGRRLRARPPVVVAVSVAALATVAQLGAGTPPQERMPPSAYALGASAWGQGVDIRQASSVALTTHDPLTSPLSMTRWGTPSARAPAPAMLVAAPFARGGPLWLLILHGLLLMIGIAGAAKLALDEGSPMGAAFAGTLALIPGLETDLLQHGPALMSLASASWALAWHQRRPLLAGVLAVLSAWVVQAPVLTIVAVAWLAKAQLRVLLGGTLVTALWLITNTLLWGHPLATSESAVVVAEGVTNVAPGLSIVDLIAGRGWLIVGAAIALPLAERRVGIAGACLVASACLPSVASSAGGSVPLVVLAGALLIIGSALTRMSELSTSPRAVTIASLTVLVGLFAAGLVDRASAAGKPFRFQTYESVRHAKVVLGDDIPCDFLAWEHLTWECSHHDRSAQQQVGLLTSEPVTVGAHPGPFFLITTSSRPQRSVSWAVELNQRLLIRYGVPEGMRGNGTMKVFVDDELRQATRLRADSATRVMTIPTEPGRGTIRIELAGPMVAVAIRGGVY